MTVGIYPRMALSGRFDLRAFIRSRTATSLGLYNIPRDVSVIENLKALCTRVLEPVAERMNGDLQILSGYRCHTLNRLLREPADSPHTRGEAAAFLIRGVSAYDAAFALAAFDDLPVHRLALVHRRMKGGVLASYIHISHRRMDENDGHHETWFLDGETHHMVAGIQPADFLKEQAAA